MKSRRNKESQFSKYLQRKLNTRIIKFIIIGICILILTFSYIIYGGYIDSWYRYIYKTNTPHRQKLMDGVLTNWDHIITPADLEGEYSKFDNITGSSEMIVPDRVHYVLFNYKEINFVTFFSMVSVIKIHKPSKLIIHTDYKEMGGRYLNILKWVIEHIPAGDRTILEVKYMEQPKEIHGKKLSSVQHASDIARINILTEEGGIYLDTDQLVLKPLHKYLHFEMAVGWQKRQYLGTQILIAAKNSRFLKLWLKSYEDYQPERWYYNAGELPTVAILYKHPEIVHRVKEAFMLREIQKDIWANPKWTAWKDYDSIHLFIRFPPASNLQIDEEHIHTLNCGGGKMANYVFYELEPKIDFSLFKN